MASWVSSAGRFVTRFESELAASTGTAHAVACNSGTAALHTALAALGVSEGDEVVTTPMTDIGTVAAIWLLGFSINILTLLALVGIGALSTTEALAGFSAPIVVMIASLFVIGEGLFAEKRPTLMFNGYADQVADLYRGMDLAEFY